MWNFSRPGIEPVSPHWQVDSYPLDHLVSVSYVLAIFPCYLAQAVPGLPCHFLVLNLEPLAAPQGHGSLYMGTIFWNQYLTAYGMLIATVVFLFLAPDSENYSL